MKREIIINIVIEDYEDDQLLQGRVSNILNQYAESLLREEYDRSGSITIKSQDETLEAALSWKVLPE